MARKVCEYYPNPQMKYGPFPLDHRFACDSVPMEMDRRKYTLNDIGSGSCFIKGCNRSSSDLTKRVATVHLTVRLKGEQLVKPFIILRNPSPASDRKTAPGLEKNVTFLGERAIERTFYGEGVEVYFDPKAWLSQTMAFIYADYFVEKTEVLTELLPVGKPPYVALQQDGLAAQNHIQIRKLYHINDIFILRTPPKSTDVCSLIDDEIGQWYKRYICDRFWEDLVEDPDKRHFLNEKLRSSDKRILLTQYASEAWVALKNESKMIFKCAQRVGYANCRCGCENHKIRVGNIVDYDVPKLGTPKMKQLTREKAKQMALINSALRKDKKEEKKN